MKKTFMTLCAVLMFVSVAYAQIDYDLQVQPVFNADCGQCHGGTSGVTVTSYAATMASVGAQYGTLIVAPGDTGASPLWDKINPDPEIGNVMPPQGAMTEDTRNIIGQWILEGALETPTSVHSDLAQPEGFALVTCYPNPFNPNTTVRVSLARSSQITLTVYDLMGRPVHQQTGSYGSGLHDISLALSPLASGVYFVRMQTVRGDRWLTSNAMKLMLMK